MATSAQVEPRPLPLGAPPAKGLPDRLALARRTERRIGLALTAAHLLGAIDVLLLLFFVLPEPHHAESAPNLVANLIAFAVYLPLALVTGQAIARRRFAVRNRAWFVTGRPPTERERDETLKVPQRCFVLEGGFWLGGLVLFTLINLSVSAEFAGHVAVTILLGGLTVCATAYLLAERLHRPISAIALAEGGAPARPVGPGIKGRLVLAWLFASGVPLAGIVMTGIHGLEKPSTTTVEGLALSVLILGVAAIVVGAIGMWAVAETVAAPLARVRRALARVEAGDLAPDLRVDDGSEVGLLQNGVNRMVAGLRERERLRALYGRQVGEDVARAALEGDEPALGGEIHEVAVLFVDLVGSTSLAAERRPEEVVGLLNRFFAVVVGAVGDHGGWVNKFEGDAALCVFGAPIPQDDPAGCALAAARDLVGRLEQELPGLRAGVGVSAGPAVAGWVGAEERFEYTVIGDPVNEAARLCDLAKGRPHGLLASEAAVTRAHADETRRWSLGGHEHLRGRPRPTRVAAPADASPARRARRDVAVVG